MKINSEEEIFIEELPISKICNGNKLTQSVDYNIENFVIDSREVNKNDCFIGIKGENNNGNLYVETALENGANVCIVDEMPDDRIIKIKRQNLI